MLLASSALVSCANSSSAIVADYNAETLRSRAENKENSTLWTRELESMRLAEDITHAPDADSSVKLTPSAAAVCTYSAKPLYPQLEGFGSLDTSLLSQDVRNVLDSFCRAVSAEQPVDTLMAKDSLYSAVLFQDDLKGVWKERFNEDFPEKADGLELFTRTLYGEPFIDSGMYDIPVRLYCAAGYIDTDVSLVQEDGAFKINQIQIRDRENTDGQ